MRMFLLKVLIVVSVLSLIVTGSVWAAILSVAFASLLALEKNEVTHLCHKQCTYKFSQNY
jgi:hypothetical protein